MLNYWRDDIWSEVGTVVVDGSRFVCGSARCLPEFLRKNVAEVSFTMTDNIIKIVQKIMELNSKF